MCWPRPPIVPSYIIMYAYGTSSHNGTAMNVEVAYMLNNANDTHRIRDMRFVGEELRATDRQAQFMALIMALQMACEMIPIIFRPGDGRARVDFCVTDQYLVLCLDRFHNWEEFFSTQADDIYYLRIFREWCEELYVKASFYGFYVPNLENPATMECNRILAELGYRG